MLLQQAPKKSAGKSPEEKETSVAPLLTPEHLDRLTANLDHLNEAEINQLLTELGSPPDELKQ